MYGPETRVIEAQRAMTRALAITVACESCHSPVGEPCRNLFTGEPLDNSSHQAAHLRRLQDSKAV